MSESGITWVALQELDAKEAHDKWSVPDPSTNEKYVAGMKEDYNQRVNPQPYRFLRGEKRRTFKPFSETVMHFDGQVVAEGCALQSTGHGLAQAFLNAWGYHEAVVVSPDDVWMAIQGIFCKYMEAHAEELRSTFVDHEGKKKLEVDMSGAGTTGPSSWNEPSS